MVYSHLLYILSMKKPLVVIPTGMIKPFFLKSYGALHMSFNKHYLLFFLITLFTSSNLFADNNSILFDDSLQNGASFYAGSSAESDFSPVGEPIFAGSHSIKLVMDSWTQAGIGIHQTAPTTDQTVEMMVYRVAGSQGTFGVRYGSGWTHLLLTDENNEFWSIDGTPGNYNFTDDAWHKLAIDLAGLGISNEFIHTMTIMSDSDFDTYYLDEITFAPQEPITPTGLILFDESMQNGTSFYAGSGAESDFTPAGEPVFAGNESIKLVMDSWTQAGIGINQTAPAVDQTLEMMVYRVAGSQGTFGMRYGSSWTHLLLTDENSEFWSIDGAPGNYTFTDDAWHKLVIDLAGLGIGDEHINTMTIMSDSDSDTFYLDEIGFTRTALIINGAPTFTVSSPQSLSETAANIQLALAINEGVLAGNMPFQAAVNDPDGDPIHISKVDMTDVPVAGLTDTITFSHSAGSFTAEYTLQQNGDYSATFTGDLTAIPAGENATAQVTVFVADDQGNESATGLVIDLVIVGDPEEG